MNAIFSLGIKEQATSTDATPDSENTPTEEKKQPKKRKNEPYLREINVTNGNPFISNKDNNTLEKCPGSPLYYKDYNNGGYVIGVINESYDFQYLDNETMVFLSDIINKGRLLRIKIHKGIDEENIVKLDLSRNDFGPLDIKYLTDFDLKKFKNFRFKL